MVQGQKSRDLYAQLGVARDADADAIKKAYRKLAQKYHPDRNDSDPAAEERFKQISAAYAVLSDEKRRKDYDDFGDIAIDPNFDADKARQAGHGFGGGFGPGGVHFERGDGGGGFQDLGGFGSLFEDLFRGGGGQARPRQRRGADLETSIELDFTDAVLGCEQRISLDRGGERQNLSVRIPAGVEEGAKIRLAGKGQPGQAGGPPGDLFARVKIRPHRYFKRTDKDLGIEVPISVGEAIKGASIDVPTLTGTVSLRVPPGTDGGSRLRLRGKGVPGSSSAAAGDLYVTIRIRVPKGLGDEATEQLDALLDDDPGAWRSEAFS